MIDFVVVCSSDCHAVLYGYPSDERGILLVRSLYLQLVRAKLCFGFQQNASVGTKRQKPLAVHKLACVNTREEYQTVLAQKLAIQHT